MSATTRTQHGSALAVGRVARALHEAEFTRGDRQTGYHTGARSGYQRNLRGGWTYESDCSVAGGELVSPILSNTPETWHRLNEACTIITQYGGVASSGTGSHVTVSAPDQAGRAVRLNRFLSLMHHHHQQELFRFFTLAPADVAFVDPGRGRGLVAARRIGRAW